MSKTRRRIKTGHLLELFMEASEVWKYWNPGDPEPTVILEPDYEFEGNPGAVERNATRSDRLLTVSQVCGSVWNCTDILPVCWFQELQDCGLDLKRRTYVAAARAIKEACRIQRLSQPNASPVETMHGLIGYDS